MSDIKYCQDFELSNITLQRRLKKNEIDYCNVETVLIKFIFS